MTDGRSRRQDLPGRNGDGESGRHHGRVRRGRWSHHARQVDQLRLAAEIRRTGGRELNGYGRYGPGRKDEGLVPGLGGWRIRHRIGGRRWGGSFGGIRPGLGRGLERSAPHQVNADRPAEGVEGIGFVHRLLDAFRRGLGRRRLGRSWVPDRARMAELRP